MKDKRICALAVILAVALGAAIYFKKEACARKAKEAEEAKEAAEHHKHHFL